MPNKRDELLGWALPLMLGCTLATWAIAFIAGFALIELPLIHDPATFSLTRPASSIEDALFFSGSTFFNLGAAEITPLAIPARGLAVVEGGLGLLSVSLAVTYLLNVYPVLSRKVAVAEGINQVTGGRADGVLAAARYLPIGRGEVLAERLDRLNDDLLYLAHAHRLYPVLYYVRSREVHESFVRVLAVAQGLVGTLRYGLDPDTYVELARDPRLLMLEEGLLDTLHLLARSSHLSVSESDAAAPVTRSFEDLHRELLEQGLRPVAADPQARAEYARFRDATEPLIRAYARNIGYSADVVWKTYGRRARNSALDEWAESRRRAA